MKRKPFGMFSFFTGAGFLDLGFERGGFVPLSANEIDPSFAKVYKFSRERMGLSLPAFGLQEESIANFLDRTDRRKWLRDRIDEAKERFALVGFVGGPPCPDFSVAGKQAGSEGKHGHLSQIYLDAIRGFQPDFFVFENVKGLMKTAKHRAFFDSIVRQARAAGYATDWRLVNSLWYGVAQDRDRVLLFGIRKSLLRTDAADADYRSPVTRIIKN